MLGGTGSRELCLGGAEELPHTAARTGLQCLRRLNLASVDSGIVRVHDPARWHEQAGDADTWTAAVLELGATKHPHQPGTSFRVFLDPAGHPFCLCVS